MKIPKKVYLIAAVTIFVAGCATVFALKPEPRQLNAEESSLVTNQQETRNKRQVADGSPVVAEEPKSTQTANPVAVPSKPVSTPETQNQTQSVNHFQRGRSEWYVFNRRAELGKPIPEWDSVEGGSLFAYAYCQNLASKHGYSPSNNPTLYAVMCMKGTAGSRGHMAVVEQVNSDGSVWVSEMNSQGQLSITDSTPVGGPDRVDYKMIPASIASGQTYYQ